MSVGQVRFRKVTVRGGEANVRTPCMCWLDRHSDHTTSLPAAADAAVPRIQATRGQLQSISDADRLHS